MHQTIRYSGTRDERFSKAVEDAKFYLGEVFYDKCIAYVTDVLSNSEATGRQKIMAARCGLSFAGVQGLPARAMIHDAHLRIITGI